MTYFDHHVTTKGQLRNLTSGHITEMTQVGHVAYQSMRLVKANSLAPSPRLYLFSIKSYGQKTYIIMTRYDVIRPLYVFAHN